MQKPLEPLDYLHWSNNATNYNNTNITFKWTIKTLELKGLSQLKQFQIKRTNQKQQSIEWTHNLENNNERDEISITQELVNVYLCFCHKKKLVC